LDWRRVRVCLDRAITSGGGRWTTSGGRARRVSQTAKVGTGRVPRNRGQSTTKTHRGGFAFTGEATRSFRARWRLKFLTTQERRRQKTDGEQCNRDPAVGGHRPICAAGNRLQAGQQRQAMTRGPTLCCRAAAQDNFRMGRGRKPLNAQTPAESPFFPRSAQRGSSHAA